MDFNRNLLSSEGGVSEIVGSILTMSITVVLFSSIFAGVQYLEPPEQTTHVSFNSDVEGISKSTHYVNITHRGGKDLQTVNTEIYITIDENTHTYSFKDSNLSLSGNDDTLWSLDEVATVKDSDGNLPLSSAETATVMVVNSGTNSVIWRDELFTGPQDDGIVIRGAGVSYPQSWEKHAKPGDKVNIWAEARKPGVDPEDLDVKMVPPKDLFEEMDYNLSYRSTHHTGRYTIEEDNVENGTYVIRIVARDGTNRTTTPISINIGEPPFDPHPPDLIVGDITFDPIAPHDRESLTVTAKIYNEGSMNITANLTFSDNDKNVSHPSLDHKFMPGPVPTEVSVSYTVNGSGLHRIGVEVYNLRRSEDGDSLEDEDPGDNKMVENLTVDPSILIVDDDQEPMGSEYDEVSAMESALEERAYDPDITEPIIKGENGPSYGEGKYRMQKYGVVIWMTGRQTAEDPLTFRDQTEIMEYIEKGGKFWLIGENLEGKMGATLRQKCGIDRINSGGSIDPPLKADDPDENGTYGKYSYDTKAGTADIITTSGSPAYNDSNVLRDDNGAGKVIGYGKNSTTPGHGKTVVNTFMFNTLRSIPKGTMAQEVLEWLTDVTDRGGKDVSVATQTIDPVAPMYKTNVTINATIRNNGDEAVDVPVRMQVDDSTELVSPDKASDKSLFIPPNGATRTVQFTWNAQPVGVHDLKVIADPYEQIEEINERNNDITYKNLNVTGDEVRVVVRFSVLIVDDDQESGSISSGNTAKLYKNILENLDKEGVSRYAYNVTEVVGPDESGPSLSTMKRYNAIFWVTGHESNTLTGQDIDNLIDPDNKLGESAYLESGGSNLLLTGDNVLQNLTGGVTPWEKGIDMLNWLGVDESSINHVYPDRLLGVKNDPLGHGMKYEFDGNLAESFGSPTGINSEVFLKDEHGRNIGARRANDNTKTKSIVIGSKLSDVQGPVRDEFGNWPGGDVNTSDWAAWEEFIFMTTRWFGLKDERPEVRVTGEDIELSNSHPMVSRSYRIRVKVENVGYKGANVLVRVKDGEQHVGSDSVYVPPTTRTAISPNYYEMSPGSATVEINWQPVAAGVRNIRAEVDSLNLAKEVGSEDGDEDMQFNNLGMIREEVYFFWDDMENGTGNWKHEATVMNVNGESPLDFINRQGLDTNVVGDWDWNYSGSTDFDGNTYFQGKGTYNTDNESVEPFTDGAAHSVPSARWMPEVESRTQEATPVDVVFALDTSGSMDGDRWRETREATIDFIQELNPTDRAAIWRFDPSGGWDPDPYQLEPLARMESANKSHFINELQDIGDYDPTGNTPFYDTLGEAIKTARQDDPDCSDDSRYEFVMGLTDGASNCDDWWSPKADWGDTTSQGGGNSGYGSYDGLIGAPPMVYTMGMVSNSLHDGSYPDAPYWRHNPSHDGSPDLEYDLWRSADETPGPLSQAKYGTREEDNVSAGVSAGDPYRGHYYYAQNADDLGTVFESIRNIIAKISGGGAGGIKSMPPDGGDEDKPALSVSQSAEESSSINFEEPPLTTQEIKARNSQSNIEKTKEPSLQATTNVFQDDFESGGMTGWTRSNGVHAAELTYYGWQYYYSISGTYSMFLYGSDVETYYNNGWHNDPGNDNAYGYHNVDLSGVSGDINTISLSFDEARYRAEGADDFNIYVRPNGGSWTLVDQYSGDANPNSRNYDITSQVGTSSSSFDLLFQLDVNWDEIWVVDDVSIDVDYTEDDDGDDGDEDVDYNIPNRQYRFLTTDQFRLGRSLLKFRATQYSSDFGTVKIDYQNKRWWLNAGPDSDWYPGKEEGDLAVLQDGDNLQPTLQNQPVAFMWNKHNGSQLWRPTLHDTVHGVDLTLNMQPIDNAKLDFVVIWEDLHNSNGLGGGGIDGDGDHWVRCTLLEDGQYRVDVYRAKGGYRHDFHIGAEKVYSKPEGVSWTNESGGIYYETHDSVLPRFVSKASHSELQFYHRYWMTEGTNGGFIYIWMSNDPHDWKWDPDHRYYVKPRQSYTGNLDMNFVANESTRGGPMNDNGLVDANGNLPYWCFNGRSGHGTLDWEFTRVDLTQFISEYSYARVAFVMAQPGGLNQTSGWRESMGWYIDDVKVVTTGANPSPDYWKLTSGSDAHSGKHYWSYQTPLGDMAQGVDSSLISDPIDLTNADYATFLAQMKFNIHPGAALPPDSFRVEVTTDGGKSWNSITYGVRAAWGYSGQNDSQNLGGRNYGGISNSVPQGYSGVPGEVEDGQFIPDGSYSYDWVPSVSLARLNADLSGFAGNVIRLRFRIVTNTTEMYAADSLPHGFCLDDVIVFGKSIGLDDSVTSSVTSTGHTLNSGSTTDLEYSRDKTGTSQTSDDVQEEQKDDEKVEQSESLKSRISIGQSTKAIESRKEIF